MPARAPLLIFIALLHAPAPASVLLSEGDAWKLQASGFLEANLARDTRPSYLETIGNNPITGPDTPAGPRDGGVTQFWFRHSRAAFTLTGAGGWKPKAYAELDLLGNREHYPLWGARDTIYTNPSLRFRHWYLAATHANWQITAGQTWMLFGWGPNYFITTASPSPGPGVIYQRTKQVTAVRSWDAGEDQWQFGFSIANASQRAGGIPNLDAGVRFATRARSSGFASATGDVKAQPLSLAWSGTYRKFATGSHSAISPDLKKYPARAFAVDALIPLIPSRDGTDTSNTLTLTAEFSGGTGYGGAFSAWSGNLPLFPYSSFPPSQRDTWMNKGYGGYDQNGDFHLFRLQSWNAQLQYHFPFQRKTFATLGYSELKSANVAGLGPVPGGFTAYDKVAMRFINLFHDFTPNWRAALEYAHNSTHYVDGSDERAERYLLSAYYRF